MDSEETKETVTSPPLNHFLEPDPSQPKNDADLDLSNLSKTQLVEMVSRIRL